MVQIRQDIYIRDSGDKLVSLKKNMKKKCLYVQKEKKIAIPILIINFSGHFSGHFLKKGHYIMSIAAVPPRAHKAT